MNNNVQNRNANGTSIQSVCIDKVKFTFVILLIIFHSFSESPNGVNLNNYPLTNCIKNCVNSFLNGDSIVAVYYFISGYLFFNSKEWTTKTYCRKIKRRFRTLFIPYIIWNAIAIIFVIIKSLPLFDEFQSYQNTTLNLSLQNIVSCFWMYNGQLSLPPIETENYDLFTQVQYYPINTALWYVRDLMIIVLISPIIHFLIKKLQHIALIFIGMLYAIFSFWYVDWHINQILLGTFYFTCGAQISINRKLIIDIFRDKYRISLLLYIMSSLVLLFTNSTNLRTTFKLIHSFVTVILAFNLTYDLYGRTSMNGEHSLGALSCFIYMSHCIVVPRIFKIINYAIKPSSDMGFTGMYLFTVITTLMILTSSYIIIKKISPTTMSYLIGRK